MAGFNIQEFRSKLAEKPPHKTSHYEMQIGLPAGLRSTIQSGDGTDIGQNIRNASTDLKFQIETTTLPGVSMATDEVRRHGIGAFERVPYAPIFSELRGTIVRSDEDGMFYNLFQAWMKLISDFESMNNGNRTGLGGSKLWEMSYPADYMTDASIRLFSSDDQKVPIELRLLDLYPIYLGDTPLSYMDTAVVKFPVIFTFHRWENILSATSIDDQAGF